MINKTEEADRQYRRTTDEKIDGRGRQAVQKNDRRESRRKRQRRQTAVKGSNSLIEYL